MKIKTGIDPIILIQESAKQDTKLGECIVNLLEETYGFVDWATRVKIKHLIEVAEGGR
jgi:hypothetical protein